MTTFGRYTLVRKLAVGGMAEVFLARADGPMGFQKRCVVKRILPHFSDDPAFVQMFLAEARLAAELNHPNLVQIFDFGEVDGQYFIAMEYIDGPNLRMLNREVRARKGPLRVNLAARIISQAAEGLHFAHELRDEAGQLLNLVHRDISPDNILVSRSGAVKVVDFGIAKAANQPHLTKSGTVKGKLAYMPPEQLAREAVDRRSDIFALGVVLFELVTGEMPFDATSEVSIIQAILGQEPLRRLRSLRLDAPPMLDDIIARCLEKSVSDRYPSCIELMQDLERFLQRTGSVGAGDIAQEVQESLGAELDASGTSKVPTGGGLLDATVPRPKSQGPLPASEAAPPADRAGAPVEPAPPRRAPVRRVDPSVAETIRSGEVAPAPQRSPDRNHLAIIAGLALLAVVGAAGAFLLLREGTTMGPRTPPIEARPPIERLVPTRDAGAEPVQPPPVEDVAAVDAGAVVTGYTAEPADPAHHQVAPSRTGRLELRIRPYATVSIDGHEVGDTPLPPQTLTVGRHKVRLVNSGLQKDVVLEIVVKPGDNLLKHNLKE